MINYATKIKEYRNKHFITQEEFARLIGVSTVSVIRWEGGKYNPTTKAKRKIAELFAKSGMNIFEE